MSEAINSESAKGTEPSKEVTSATPEGVQADVVLKPEQYKGIIERLEEQEALIERLSSNKDRSEDEIDALAEEGRRTLNQNSTPQQRKDLEEMSNAEVVNVIFEQLKPFQQELHQSIETLRIQREIDKCESKFNDFHLYDKEIMKIAIDNPKLSIEKAYKLAKVEDPDRGKISDDGKLEKRTKSERILNLPKPGSFGEKPNASVSVTELGGTLSVKDAARQAAIELGLGD
jgi:hypothetical protein